MKILKCSYSRSDFKINYVHDHVEITLDGDFVGSEDTKHDAQEAIRNGEYDQFLNKSDNSVKETEKKKKSSLVRLIKSNEPVHVYILMNSDYMSPDRNSKMTKITSDDNGWVRAYFDVKDALVASSKRNPYYDVYDVWVQNGKIIFGRGFHKLNDERLGGNENYI